MPVPISVSLGHCSDRGCKTVNQDFHGAQIPRGDLLRTKGIALAIADGISSSEVSQIASETAVKNFLSDYYATSESWSVKQSVQKVLFALNSWLYAQTRNGPYRYNVERGYVCTFTALVLKGMVAHIFHIGDTRLYRLLADDSLEQITEDHRLWVSREKSYLRRALGMSDGLEVDYYTLDLESGDIFILASDGVYEFVAPELISRIVYENLHDLDRAASLIVSEALSVGSDDNLTIQLLLVDKLEPELGSLHRQSEQLPFPPELRPRMLFDHYQIIRPLHASSRSHLFLACDEESGERVVLKTPSIELRDQTDYLERLLMEEWVAGRVDSPHLLKATGQNRKRTALYTVMEYVEGQTLKQWLLDNPAPDLERLRDFIGQMVKGLQVLHRQEMLHQDLRPDNVMIDQHGTLKLIDYGSVQVAGVAELGDVRLQHHLLGTAQYMAPEYLLGESGTRQSDQYSLGVTAYYLLSGKLPYGTAVAMTSNRSAQRRLSYRSLNEEGRLVPDWIDGAIRKAVRINPRERYDELSEFVYDLQHPNPAYLRTELPPLIERNPLRFWQGVSLLLLLIIIALLAT